MLVSSVVPTITFVCVAALCIAGNIVSSLEFISAQTPSNINTLHLWKLRECNATSAVCFTFSHMDAAQRLCPSIASQYYAAEALGVISAAAPGLFAVVSYFLARARNTESPVVCGAAAGVLMSMFSMTSSVIAFILMISLKNDSCFSSPLTVRVSLRAAPFLFAGGSALSIVNMIWYACVFGAERRAPPLSCEPASLRVAIEAPTSPARHRQQPAEAILPAHGGDQQDQRAETSVNAAERPSNAFSAQVVPDLAPGQALPDGNDWQADESSGLLWSDEKKLFFDPVSLQFYSPDTDMWFDSSKQQWYCLSS